MQKRQNSNIFLGGISLSFSMNLSLPVHLGMDVDTLFAAFLREIKAAIT